MQQHKYRVCVVIMPNVLRVCVIASNMIITPADEDCEQSINNFVNNNYGRCLHQGPGNETLRLKIHMKFITIVSSEF